MAGICGIFSLSNIAVTSIPNALHRMLGKMAINELQPKFFMVDQQIGFGNISLVRDTINSNCIFNKELNTFTLIDGLVFIDQNTRVQIIEQFSLSNNLEDKELIPYLFDFYGDNFINSLSGNYNIFIFNKTIKNAFLFNSHLGFLPLFYYHSDDYFIFSSKIEAILASGLMHQIEFDQCSLLEQLVFNYTISENTSIKNIKTLKNATCFKFNNSTVTKTSYWNLEELFQKKPESEAKSFDLINEGISHSISKILKNTNTINTSLTGGWDSRLILSYLEKVKDQIKLFSFGAINSPDIEIAKEVAIKERFKYTPILLDEDYLERDFIEIAKSTILRSSGTRNYKRTHYLYSIEKISEESDIFLSGIFGDEMLKIAKINPCSVISKYALELIAKDFNPESILSQIKNDQSLSFITSNSQVMEELEKRLVSIKSDVSHLSTIEEKYYYFRLLINLPKYFGAEANSYNDYCYNYSPFIDIDFLKNYFKSSYCGLFYPYNSGALKLKRQTTKLYCRLISTNYPQLLAYKTDRGYSIKDTNSIIGMINIVNQLFLKSKKQIDSFNTDNTTTLFKNQIEYLDIMQETALPIDYQTVKNSLNAELISLYYWVKMIANKYIA
jgi:hypothetical protein